MIGRKLVSWVVAPFRCLLGRRVRRLYGAMFLLCLALSGILRYRSYVLTRRIHAVLSGLAHVRVDETTEGQIQTLVPFLVGRDIQTATGLERQYCVSITNDEG